VHPAVRAKNHISIQSPPRAPLSEGPPSAVLVGRVVEAEEPLDSAMVLFSERHWFIRLLYASDSSIRSVEPLFFIGDSLGGVLALWLSSVLVSRMSAKPLQKEALRERFATYREGLSEREYRRRSMQVIERLAALPELAAASVVHCYWPLPKRGELDPRSLVRSLHAEGCTVALPVVASFGEGSPAMTARRYDGPGCLRENRWGLAEPAGTEAVPPETLDAVVVPAFGAGRNGHRVGHGRGFYDAFLEKASAPACCPVYDACLVGRVPAEPHDVPMDVLVTESETVRP